MFLKPPSARAFRPDTDFQRESKTGSTTCGVGSAYFENICVILQISRLGRAGCSFCTAILLWIVVCFLSSRELEPKNQNANFEENGEEK